LNFNVKYNKSEEPINYPAGNLLAHFKRYAKRIYTFIKRLFVKKRTDKAIAELANAYNGLENFHAELKNRVEESQKAWSSDSIGIGKILRSHLYAEYYLNKYLFKLYKLKEKELDNLSFYKKLVYIEEKNDSLKSLLPAIKKFNILYLLSFIEYKICAFSKITFPRGVLT